MNRFILILLASFSFAPSAMAGKVEGASRGPASVEPASSVVGTTSLGSATSWYAMPNGGKTDDAVRAMFPNPTLAVSPFHIDPKTGQKFAKTDITLNDPPKAPCPCMLETHDPAKEKEYYRLLGEYQAEKVLFDAQQAK